MSTVAHTEEHHVHPHKESFITKYVFSQDHKMISKQFLWTGLLMALIGMLMSTLFRLQLGWQGESFKILQFFLGDKWAPDGVLDPKFLIKLEQEIWLLVL